MLIQSVEDSSRNETDDGALAGISVLDLTPAGPGPYCTMLLGDLGAHVLKIDWPRGSVVPSAGIGLTPGSEEWDAACNPHNRNKRSIGLNLKSEQGRKIFYRLSEKADVVLEGFRIGGAKRLCVDYDTIKDINPKIVYCSLSTWGQDGPYQKLPAHDICIISVAGVLGIMGQRGGRPAILGNLLADYAGGGMHAAVAILAALMARERTGRGQFVDIAMLDGVLSLMSEEAYHYFSTGRVPRRGETWTTGGAAYYNVYETKDGEYLALACLEPSGFEGLCRVLGREDFITGQYAEAEKQQEMFAYFSEVFLTKTRDEWFKLLSQKDMCVAPVYHLDEVFSDPQVLHRQMVVALNHPRVGKVKQIGVSMKLSDTPGGIKRLAPLPGEHTEEVLMELGYTKEAIDGLRREEAIM